MHPVAILLIGVVIVIASILVFRLHAFLALVLAALTVGLLTPRQATRDYWLEKWQINVVEDQLKADGEVLLGVGPKQGAQLGTRYQVMRPMKTPLPEMERQRYASCLFAAYNMNENSVLEREEWRRMPALISADADSDGNLKHQELSAWQPALLPVAELEVTGFRRYEDSRGDAKLGAVAANVGPKFNEEIGERDLVVHAKDIAAANKQSSQTVGERVASAFGTTAGKIGILIALAAIIGKCLLDSGAADRIVRSALRVVGERGAPVAFIGSGFLLGIPVFFDTVFYLMIPLGKALRMRTGRNYLLYVLTIVAGGTMAHSLVPPTPGPLLVAEELGVDIGLMIMAGCIVGLFSSTAGLFYAQFMNRRNELPLRDSSDFSLDDIETIAKRDINELPSLFVSLLPILLPVVLIAGNTVIKSFDLLPKDSSLLPVTATLGNKNIALAIAAAIAMGTLAWQKRSSLRELAEPMQGALASGGVIILITSAGGAFGGMLQQTGVAGLIRDLPPYSPQVIVILAFLITTAIRSAQGSATVAMITAVGILASFNAGGDLGFHPVYLALAIGCGSKPIAWMNDSGFWVICKMSGMTETEGLKYVTPMSILMGAVGLGVTLLGVTFFPMA